MVMHEITVRFVVTPARLRWGLFALLCLALPQLAATADVATLMTFYPSPAAAFPTVTAINDVSLARDGGDVSIGSVDNDNQRVYVGDTGPDNESSKCGPNFNTPCRLRVYGTLRVDGCIWLDNGDSKKGYRCKWEP